MTTSRFHLFKPALSYFRESLARYPNGKMIEDRAEADFLILLFCIKT